MILPDKNIKLKYSLINCGTTVLKELNEPQSVTFVWEKVKSDKQITSFEKFLLTLDFLYIIQAIKLEDGLLMRCNNDTFDKEQ